MQTLSQTTDTGNHRPQPPQPWKLLIVDDEPDVHALTKLLLRNFNHRERGIEFLSAHSAEEARPILRDHPDIALVLLDVVMESDHAGIELIDYIRKELGNTAMQIVIRTGQPGQAPPLTLVRSHSINDYKEKTELTQQSMLLTVVKALRLYEELQPTYASAAKYDALDSKLKAGADDRELLRLLKGTADAGEEEGGSDSRLSSLTDREREVLKWLSLGDSNKAIALRLGVQEVTVKAHLRQIFTKLQVFNRTQAASLALRMHDLD
ncbi:LuxR C-terminal-related transcriptional regulator [Ferrovibrio sp.]|uniref:LuxR family transcriptional regulator n=1 Tax=Ferrovibrio sp. TaxID=1917215 RepID=UPI0035AE1A11